MLHLQIDFWNVFDIFCEVKWRHVGIKKRGRVGNDFSKIFVGCEGQVGWPNRAKREPKRPPKGGMGRPGGLGGPLGAVGPSWAILTLGGSAGGPPIWGLLAPSWRPLGAVLAFKIDSGRSKNRFQLGSKF